METYDYTDEQLDDIRDELAATVREKLGIESKHMFDDDMGNGNSIDYWFVTPSGDRLLVTISITVWNPIELI